MLLFNLVEQKDMFEYEEDHTNDENGENEMMEDQFSNDHL
jgi:hypothetical protein